MVSSKKSYKHFIGYKMKSAFNSFIHKYILENFHFYRQPFSIIGKTEQYFNCIEAKLTVIKMIITSMSLTLFDHYHSFIKRF